ncbi:MAG: hypothetical protein ACYDAQ_04130 [Mycobacteriales bacterium]
MPGQVIDTPSAEEFMGEVLARVSAEELAQISAELAVKSTQMQEVLRAGPPDADGIGRLLRHIFSTRRRANLLIDSVGVNVLGPAVFELVWGAAPVAARLDAFDAVCAEVSDLTMDLPGELLHFCRPDQYWLWTRWMWDPRIGTGALPLVTMEDVELGAPGRGETYLLVGRAVAFVGETARAARFTDPRSGPFGVDVFLAAVYGIYMYTVLRMRMTQEFTRLVPELPALVRRLLGVYYREA